MKVTHLLLSWTTTMVMILILLFLSIPPSHCLHHEDSVVELQALIKSVDKSQRYRCVCVRAHVFVLCL